VIISASRRTDIPAFYSEWMIRRIREGFCTVPNPVNPGQVSRISLRPEDVDVIVFWTRNPRPLMRHLRELDSRGFRYYFQITILGYPREIDPGSPGITAAVKTFRELSKQLGPKRVIWRYDPILFTGLTPPAFHRRQFGKLCESLKDGTRRCVVSIADRYRKIERRMRDVEKVAGERICGDDELGTLMRELAARASACGMEAVSCAEEIDLTPFGIHPGKCVDDRVIAEAFGVEVAARKDPHQRKACGCIVSRDVGMYESCVCGCSYCYATKTFEQAKANFQRHDPHSPSLLGWHEPPKQSAEQAMLTTLRRRTSS
jgi:hypothetical protein